MSFRGTSINSLLLKNIYYDKLKKWIFYNNFLSCLQYEKLVVDSRSVYNRIFNLNGSFNFTDTMNSIYHDSGKSKIVHGDEELVGFKGKFNVTYGDIKAHVNFKMRKDYEHLLHLCDELK